PAAHPVLRSFPTRRSSDLARHGLEYFATGDVPLRRADLAREALETLPRGDSGLRATLMAGVAVGALARHDLDANRLLAAEAVAIDRKSTRLNSSHVKISYA